MKEVSKGKEVRVGSCTFANHLPLTIIAGPCVMESEDHALFMAEKLKAISDKLAIPIVFKTSFDKANRTSGRSFRGGGLEGALSVFARIKAETGLPVLTDVHEPSQCRPLAEVVDILQIPAFLCRQTDLLIAAGQSGAAVNIKKGQFLAPWDMKHALTKVYDTHNERCLLTERGTTFGYNRLVVDMRALPIMAETGAPVIFDATHAVQEPGGLGGSSGGERRFVSTLACSAVAAGVAGVFLETHDNPDQAPSDGPNMIPLDQLAGLLTRLKAFDQLAKQG